jgi:hypothetical protein
MDLFIKKQLEMGYSASSIPMTPSDIALVEGHYHIVRFIKKINEIKGLYRCINEFMSLGMQLSNPEQDSENQQEGKKVIYFASKIKELVDCYFNTLYADDNYFSVNDDELNAITKEFKQTIERGQEQITSKHLRNILTDITNEFSALSQEQSDEALKDQREPEGIDPDESTAEPNIEKKEAQQHTITISNQERLIIIKNYIEQTQFVVGNYCFFQGGVLCDMEGGEAKVKRLPHRVAEIYQLIITKKYTDPDALLDKIKMCAKDGGLNPRRDQAFSTREFYNNVLQNKVVCSTVPKKEATFIDADGEIMEHYCTIS